MNLKLSEAAEYGAEIKTEFRILKEIPIEAKKCAAGGRFLQRADGYRNGRSFASVKLLLYLEDEQ